MSEVPECGTYAAAVRHVKRKEPLDEACRVARNDYVREWRNTSKGRESSANLKKARSDALRELSKLHPEDYRRLYTEALDAIRQKS